MTLIERFHLPVQRESGSYINQMSRDLPPIYFYISQAQLHGQIPESADEYWEWRVSMRQNFIFMGKFDWTLQTYLHLKDRGFPCMLATVPPREGIVIAHRDFMNDIPKPNSSTLCICLKSDRTPHPFAQIHIIQNPKDRVEGIQEQMSSYFIPHWVQPALQPRRNERGEVFENIAYAGCEIELAPEFKKKSWQSLLKDMGLNWSMLTSADIWSNYSQVDALVAIRKCKAKDREFDYKPATKLYNAWHAGIPAILGSESAYQSEKKAEDDYIEANTPEEVIEAVTLLRDSPELRRRMVENGKIRAEETGAAEIAQKWESFIVDLAVPVFYRWRQSRWIRQKYLSMRSVQLGLCFFKHGLSKIANSVK